ncbi:seminal metalloprotease 1-like [Episyrphus balteatus]|uniref:seminal metalloprotease 1-like n=1 Tax=Episyrphus balteatus TaxID=286459 RepID=UPI002485CFA0|nr:seminal metalloprotease 1-like [Episyrphus balteatus]
MMKLIIVCVIFATIFGLTIGYPTPVEKDPEQGNYFEGDIDLSEEQKLAIEGKSRNGLIADQYRWPDRNVYYKFAEGQFDGPHKNHVLRGMQILEEASCIRFIPANETIKTFIEITSQPTGCHSAVGFQNGKQNVNFQNYELDKGCFRLATIVHEFLHSLGFYHQQSASDRDEFVKIAFENIQSGMEHNFNIYNSSVVDDFGIEYDYGSVMHYGPTAFSKNGEKTIIPILDEDAEIGQRRGMSSKDIYKLNIMYKCPIQTRL